MQDFTIKAEDRSPEPPKRTLKHRLLWFFGLSAAGALATIVIIIALWAFLLM